MSLVRMWRATDWSSIVEIPYNSIGDARGLSPRLQTFVIGISNLLWPSYARGEIRGRMLATGGYCVRDNLLCAVEKIPGITYE